MPEATIGWTGTRNLSERGKLYIRRVLRALPRGTRIVTGACLGTDAFVAREAVNMGFNVTTIVPANLSQVDPEWEEWCDNFIRMHEGSSYRDRNEAIVRSSTAMYAVADYGEHHSKSLRSGTWMTIRIARRAHVPVEVFVQHE